MDGYADVRRTFREPSPTADLAKRELCVSCSTSLSEPRFSRCLVTGGAGFLGSHLVRVLLRKPGRLVLACGHDSKPGWRLGNLTSEAGFRYSSIDVLDPSAIAGAVRDSDAEVVFHCAAVGPGAGHGSHEKALATNVGGALNVWSARAQAAVVFVGSGFEYRSGSGRKSERAPLGGRGPYSWSKLCVWSYLTSCARSEHDRWLYVRPFGIYGPYESPRRLLPTLVCHLLDGRAVKLSEGTQRRDFCLAEDVAEGCIRGAEALLAGAVARRAVNLCSGDCTPVREVVEYAADQLGRPDLVQFGKRSVREEEPEVFCGDPRRARMLLGWSASTMWREGVKRTVEWLIQNVGRYSVYRTAEG